MCKICDHRAIRCSGFQTTQISSPPFVGQSKSSETHVNVPIRNTPKAVSFGLQDPPNPPRAHSSSVSPRTPSLSPTRPHSLTLSSTRSLILTSTTRPHTPTSPPTITASASAGPRIRTANSVTENKSRTVRKAVVPDKYASAFNSATRSKSLAAAKVANPAKSTTFLESPSRPQSVNGLKPVNSSQSKPFKPRCATKPLPTSKASCSPTSFLPKSSPTSSFPLHLPRHVSPPPQRRVSPTPPRSSPFRDPLLELVHSLDIPALRARLRSTATVTFIDSLGLTAAATVTKAVVVDISAVPADPSTDTVHWPSPSTAAAASRHFHYESSLGEGALHATVAGTGSHPLGGVSRSGLEPRVTTATLHHHRPQHNTTTLSTPWSGHHSSSSGLASPTNLSTPLGGSTLSLDPNINFGLYATLDVVASSEKLEDPYTYVSRVDPDDLLSHPDLGPPSVRASPPKSLPDLGVKESPHIKKTSKDVENYARKISSSVEEEFGGRGLAAKSSEEDTISSEPKSPGTAGEVRQQIRECLERVRSRRHQSSSESSTKYNSPYCSSTLATPTTSSGSASGLSNPSTRKSQCSDPEHSDSKASSSSSTPASFSIGSVRSTPERESVGGPQSSSYSLNPPSSGQPRSAASFAAGLYRLESLLRRGSPSGRVSREASPVTVAQSKKDERSSSPVFLRRSEEREGRPRQRRGSSSVEQDGPAIDSGTTTCDASTITDVHQSADLAEVEIISLVQEQIPLYKLRADAAATAAGCSRDSWGGIVPFPALDPSDEALSPLSPDQAQATLDYFEGDPAVAGREGKKRAYPPFWRVGGFSLPPPPTNAGVDRRDYRLALYRLREWEHQTQVRGWDNSSADDEIDEPSNPKDDSVRKVGESPPSNFFIKDPFLVVEHEISSPIKDSSSGSNSEPFKVIFPGDDKRKPPDVENLTLSKIDNSGDAIIADDVKNSLVLPTSVLADSIDASIGRKGQGRQVAEICNNRCGQRCLKQHISSIGRHELNKEVCVRAKLDLISVQEEFPKSVTNFQHKFVSIDSLRNELFKRDNNYANRFSLPRRVSESKLTCLRKRYELESIKKHPSNENVYVCDTVCASKSCGDLAFVDLPLNGSDSRFVHCTSSRGELRLTSSSRGATQCLEPDLIPCCKSDSFIDLLQRDRQARAIRRVDTLKCSCKSSSSDHMSGGVQCSFCILSRDHLRKDHHLSLVETEILFRGGARSKTVLSSWPGGNSDGGSVVHVKQPRRSSELLETNHLEQLIVKTESTINFCCGTSKPTSLCRTSLESERKNQQVASPPIPQEPFHSSRPDVHDLRSHGGSCFGKVKTEHQRYDCPHFEASQTFKSQTDHKRGKHNQPECATEDSKSHGQLDANKQELPGAPCHAVAEFLDQTPGHLLARHLVQERRKVWEVDNKDFQEKQQDLVSKEGLPTESNFEIGTKKGQHSCVAQDQDGLSQKSIDGVERSGATGGEYQISESEVKDYERQEMQIIQFKEGILSEPNVDTSEQTVIQSVSTIEDFGSDSTGAIRVQPCESSAVDGATCLMCVDDQQWEQDMNVVEYHHSLQLLADEIWLGDEDVDLTVACGNRVSQMTRTYNDIDAVTRLLEEKEKDLELAARIGQQLVGRNRALEERQAALEAELAAVSDTTTQLQHQLTLKTNLLSIYIDDVDDSSCDTTPSAVRHISVDLLQEKVRALQDDNRTLRDEASRLAGETTQCEERETSLMHDVIKQLDSANQQVLQLSHEARQKNDEALKQHEETTLLLAQLVEMQAKLKESASVNTELQSMVLVSRECQQELTAEIAELKERYAEVLDLLHDTQEQLRRYTKKNLGSSVGRSSRPIGGMALGSGGPLHYSASTYLGAGNDSIASELSSLDPSPTPPPSLTGTSSAANVSRVFDTVKLSSRPQSSLSSSYGSGYSSYTPGYASYTPGYASYTPGYSNGPGYAPGYTSHTPGIAGYNSNTNRSGYTPPSYSGHRSGPWDSGLSVSGSMTASGHPSLDSGADSDMHTDPEDNYPASTAGVPGYPGTPDLNSCLRRIRPAHMHVLSSGGGEKDAPRTATTSTPSSQQQVLPYGCRTPDSIMATGGTNQTMIATEFQGLRYPCANKLQIIKPLEGSVTLHQWSRLAKPDLAVLLQPHREGIAIKSAVNIRRELEPFSLSDLEEDEETTPTPPSVPEPRKQFMPTSGVFTYTNSTVMLVDDCTQPTNARTGGPNMSCSLPKNTYLHSSTTLTTTTASPGGPSSSLPASRRGSTATFSTNVGLARVLQERGVANAATASSSAAAYTATPANSPEGSGSNTPVKGSYILPALQEIRSGLLYGATMIRRTLYPSPPSSPILEGGGQLLQRVTDLSLPTLAEGGSYHQCVGGVLTPRPVPPSPLMHLSKLIQGTLPPPSEPCSDLPSPELPSPGTRRPPLPYNHPLGMPGEPGTGQLDRLRAPRAGGPRRDLGTVPRPPIADRGQKMGQLGVMSVGRKGGLL